MTQEQIKEQIKEQAIDYVTNNLDNKAILEVIIKLFENNIKDTCYDYIRESNRLTTAQLIVEEILKND